MRTGLVVLDWRVVSVGRLDQRRRFGAHCLLFAFSPRHGHERGLVEPWFLIDQSLHEDFDALETGAQWPDYGDNLLLA